MNILITILLVILAILLLILVLAWFSKKNYYVECSVNINASNQSVFDYIKQLKNQDHFNKWVMADPAMKKEFKGKDGTVGFVYAWDGNKKAGEGEQEIKVIIEGKSIECEIRFKRPFSGLAKVNFSIETILSNQTKVSWSNESKMVYPLNIMLPMIEKMLAKDMDESLAKLKTILEA